MHQNIVCLFAVVLTACGADAGSSVDVEEWNDVESTQESGEELGDDEQREGASGHVDLGTAELAQTAPGLVNMGCFPTALECELMEIQFELGSGWNCICVIDTSCTLQAPIGVQCDF
jgi:hypothetical protein